MWAIFGFLALTTWGVLIGGWFKPAYLPTPLAFLAPLWLGWLAYAGHAYMLKDSKVSATDFMEAGKGNTPEQSLRQWDGHVQSDQEVQ